jgi:proteasome alpha subunit
VLGSVFTREMKSLEVEILVVEIKEQGSAFYQIRYDGSMTDTTHYAAIGGDGDKLIDVIRGGWRADLTLRDAAKLGRRALAGSGNGASLDDLDERTLEIAILDRTRQGRTFKRFGAEEARSLFSG